MPQRVDAAEDPVLSFEVNRMLDRAVAYSNGPHLFKRYDAMLPRRQPGKTPSQIAVTFP